MLDRNLTEALAPERSFRDDEWMTGERREALRAICDTVVGAIEQTRDPHGFWARSATDVGTDAAIVAYLSAMPDVQRGGLLGLIDALGGLGIAQSSPQSREQLLTTTALLARRRPSASA
jgi:hypothetical protein